MSPIVMKFGGTSVADLERINHVADVVAKQAETNPGGVAVIVSAMAGQNQFLPAETTRGVCFPIRTNSSRRPP